MLKTKITKNKIICKEKIANLLKNNKITTTKEIVNSVIVGSGFNPIGLIRPTLTLGSGKFPSPTGWGERRMRVECPTRPTRSRDAT